MFPLNSSAGAFYPHNPRAELALATRSTASAKAAVPIIDSLLAATALTHGLTLVTRDTDLVGIPGLEIFNPWTMN